MTGTVVTSKLTIPFLVCVAMISRPAIVSGDEKSGADVPHGSVAQISDWALAGVVWSDASLAKKLAVAAAKQTKDKARLDKLHQQIQRVDGVINAMQQFGWRQLHQAPTSAVAKNKTATPESDGADRRYRDSVLRAKAIDLGVEEGITGPAAAANLDEFSGLAERQITGRDVVTRSDSLPYSRNSLYDVEKYDPASVSDAGGGADAPTATRNKAVDTIVSQEVERLRESENRTLNSLVGGKLPQTNISHFTEHNLDLQADANWVQFQLDLNQMRWDKLATATISDDALTDVMMQLRARMQLASRFTQSDQLRAALAQ